MSGMPLFLVEQRRRVFHNKMMNRLKVSIAEKVAIYSLRLARHEGPLGRDLYTELGYYLTSIGVEAVALRRSTRGKLEVYLTQRTIDEAYPLQWHCPGSVLRRKEYVDNVMERLSTQEFKAPIKSFAYVDEFLHQEQRGWFLTKIYAVSLGDAAGGHDRGWFALDNLPPAMVAHHAEKIIPKAVQYYYQHIQEEVQH